MPLQATSGAATYDAFGGGPTGPANYIEDVFSTYLYTGNATARSIVNSIDLSGKGGLVWTKSRSLSGSDHYLVDTARGNTRFLNTNNVAAQTNTSDITAFNNNGYSLNADVNGGWNNNGATFASWTFREQPKFFDIVTYTGNGDADRNIAHSLGSVPGMIVIKKTSGTGNWATAASLNSAAYGIGGGGSGSGYEFSLNLTDGYYDNPLKSTIATDTTVNVPRVYYNNAAICNQSGATYVMYLFASNAGGFGLSGTDNAITCGSYTGSGAAGNNINLGYEPQWLLIKQISSSGSWVLIDNMRGFPVASADYWLYANLSNSESAVNAFAPFATGFVSKGSTLNSSGQTYIYMAIRRGPMRTPIASDSVYRANVYTGSATANTAVAGNFGFPVDLMLLSSRSGNSLGWASYAQIAFDRLRGADVSLGTSLTTVEVTGWTGYHAFDVQNSIGWGLYGANSGTNYLNNSSGWVARGFQRAPGFFDIFCYTGTGNATAQAHNLGVAPELIIIKSRTTAGTNWQVYSRFTPTTYGYQTLQTDGPGSSDLTYGPGGSPNFESFTAAPSASSVNLASSAEISANGRTYVAYLFATLAGVSKVGSYTGTGGTQTINAGLPTGARFVLIKRTDSNGSWWVWDSARGMASGTDPRLALNTASAEINNDWVYTVATGFQIVTTDATVNASGGSYIYLAIA